MALPKLGVPEFYTEIPSTGEKVKFRPFTVKQQKTLLFALQSNDIDVMVDSVHQIVDECCINIKSSSLAAFDVEFLFVKIRGKSVGEAIDFVLRHAATNPCQHRQEYTLNIDDIKMKISKHQDPVIRLEPDLGVTMKYPSFKQLTKYASINQEDPTVLINFIATVIDSVFTGEEVYSDFTEEEMIEWVSELPTTYFEKLVTWLSNTPSLKHNIIYTCDACGQEEVVELKTLSDFFTSV